jgi:peptide/nickel transport system ATP-binding protein
MSSKEMRHFRSECQIVFQNPDSSLNPRKTVGTILKRPIELFSEKSKKEIDNRVVELLNQVQLSEDYIDRYPHELSGGEKQRISIARAFAANPSFIILDEPVSSLDVSVKASILNLLSDLREEYKTSYLLISHDLSAVQHIADRVMVMYLGEIVESGPTETIFNNPKHPYTEVLLESIPILNSPDEQKSTYKLKGDVPSARDPPSGCRFHTRCPYSREACTSQSPDKISGNKDNHMAACFRELPDHPYWETETLEHAESNQDSN